MIQIKKNYSQTIDFIKYPLSLMVILLHSYTSINIDNNDYWMMSYPFLTLGEMAVPCFFFISGLLYFYNIENHHLNYKQKTINRIKSLLQPYLIWNALMIIFYLSVQSIPIFTSYFSGNNKNIIDYDCMDFINAFWDKGSWDGGNGTPILQPYWYIRNLFLLCLGSPLIFYFIKYTQAFGITILGLWWFNTYGQAFLSSSLFFFSLGAYCILYRKNILCDNIKNISILCTLSVLVFLVDYATHTLWYINWNLEIHRLSLLLGIILLLNISYQLSKKYQWSETIKKSSFFIYSVHYPIILSIRKISLKLLPIDNGIAQWGSMILGTCITIAICHVLFLCFEKYSPSFLNVITGKNIYNETKENNYINHL